MLVCTLRCNSYCTPKCMPESLIRDGLSGPSCLPMHACPRHRERPTLSVMPAAHVSLAYRARSHLCPLLHPHCQCRTRRSAACTLQCALQSACHTPPGHAHYTGGHAIGGAPATPSCVLVGNLVKINLFLGMQIWVLELAVPILLPIMQDEHTLACARACVLERVSLCMLVHLRTRICRYV